VRQSEWAGIGPKQHLGKRPGARATLAIASEIDPMRVSRLDLQSPDTEPGFVFLDQRRDRLRHSLPFHARRTNLG
jgi:hypothetical protein